MTAEAERMAGIVSALAPLLKQSGFRKRRHGFNRGVADGIVHVVHFWMAPKEPPAWTEVPGLRERRYGSFRLDFGIHVPEMTRMGEPRSAWINDVDCQLLRTCGQLAGSRTDVWWDLDDPGSLGAADETLRELGLPWLDRFPDREAVLAEFAAHGPRDLGMSPAAHLDIADVYRAIGSLDEERRTLEAYVSRTVRPSHAAYLTDYLRRHGHADLVDRITTAAT